MFVDFKRTFRTSRALGKLVWLVFTNVVALALSCVTTFAKMRVTPTEPLCKTTAKLAFEVNVLSSVFLTTDYSALN